MSAASRRSAFALIAAFVVLAILYVGGYVACRLTGVLARHEHWDDEDQRLRDQRGPRDWTFPATWVERNHIAREWKPAEMTWPSRPAAAMYAPLCALEQWYWNQPALPHPRPRW